MRLVSHNCTSSFPALSIIVIGGLCQFYLRQELANYAFAPSQVSYANATNSSLFPPRNYMGTHTCKKIDQKVTANFERPRQDNDSVPAYMSMRWIAWHCQDNTTINRYQTGRLVLKKIDGVVTNYNLSDILVEPEWADYILRARIGPDDFFCELSGPELHVLIPVVNFVSNEYYFYTLDYSVTIPGKYFIRLVHTQTHYRSVDNTVGWPVEHLDDVLGDDVFIQIGSTLPSNEINAEHATVPNASKLPNCLPNNYNPGRWVATIPFSFHTPVFTGLWPLSRRVNLSNYEWVPFDCFQKKILPGEVSMCVAGKKIAFHGDSQTRTFFNALLYNYGGVPAVAQKGLLTGQCHEFTTGTLRNSTWCFYVNLLGDVQTLRENPPNFTKWDVIYANFGQHPASYAHWLPSRYRAAVRFFLHKATELNVSKLVWAATQSIMPAIGKNRFARKLWKDWRTRPRAQLFSQIASEEAAYVSALHLDAYNLSLAFAVSALDGAHITLLPYQEILANLFFSFIC